MIIKAERGARLRNQRQEYVANFISISNNFDFFFQISIMFRRVIVSFVFLFLYSSENSKSNRKGISRIACRTSQINARRFAFRIILITFILKNNGYFSI